MRFVNMLQLFEKFVFNLISHLSFDKLAHTFSDKMRIATEIFFACIVCILIIRCIDAAYNEP